MLTLPWRQVHVLSAFLLLGYMISSGIPTRREVRMVGQDLINNQW